MIKLKSDKEVNDQINLIGFKEVQKFLNELKEHLSIRISQVEISINEVDACIVYKIVKKEKATYNVIYIDASKYYENNLIDVTLRNMNFVLKEMKYKDTVFYSKHPSLVKYKNFDLIQSSSLKNYEVSDYISNKLIEDKVYYFNFGR
jgi:hypothetical protein